MRLLFLVHAHPDQQAGGTEFFTRDLFRTLRNRGHDGLLVAGTAAHQRLATPGTAFQAAGPSPDELLVWTGGYDAFNLSQTDSYGVAAAFKELLAEFQPDIVHIHHLLVLGVETIDLIRRLAPAARIVMTLHDYYPICANDGQMVTTAGQLCSASTLDKCRACFPERTLADIRLRELHIRGALARIDHFIAPSQFLRDRYVAWGLPADRLSVIPNGLPPMLAAPAQRTPARNRFAFFGHINRFKGAALAADASAILSKRGIEHGLAIYGSTAHQSEQTITRFHTACEQAPDAHYRGPYRRDDLARLIAPVDWIVFPSEWWENAPLVINEAFIHRRPVICSDIGGSAELVRHGVNGLQFSVGDARSLADSMQRAAQEDGLWHRLVAGIVPPPTIDDTAETHLALYRSLKSVAADRIAA